MHPALFLVCVCLSLSSSSLAWAQPSGEPGRPHVLLIMTDDMGWMDLGCQGNGKLRTPQLDALASQGVRFTDAYAASPVCSPTRAALITGLAPARLNILQHGHDAPWFWPEDRTIQPPVVEHILPHARLTMAERLKAAGYATGFFGKWHLSGTAVKDDDPATGGPDFYPDQHGFDVNVGGCGRGGPPTYFDPYRIPTLKPRRKGEYLTDRLADETISWMREHHEQPMFVTLWTYNPHYPFEAPAELIPAYEGEEGPGLKNAIYGAQIEATDRALGRVLAELEALEIANETVVIFTSDNGGWSGATDNRPLREGKGHLYEGGLRVPLIIRWPGVSEAGTINRTPVISMDLTATILDATGVTLAPDDVLDGASLKPVIEGQDGARAPLTFHYPHWAFHKENRPGSAIRDGKYKLIHRYDDDSLELYDLAEDIGESTDLAKEMPELAARLKETLTHRLDELGAARPSQIR
ncbi:Arylsulfatase [Planctomycetes bacterium Poly30]|uniref:Arylsulfatase n=1 Tax=Saltatorellus ferox TaxID=2528018 RepID=A0A518ET03_9BACT|nr:Arylsulfatase [Planctomycetes bacterium Poly30]